MRERDSMCVWCELVFVLFAQRTTLVSLTLDSVTCESTISLSLERERESGHFVSFLSSVDLHLMHSCKYYKLKVWSFRVSACTVYIKECPTTTLNWLLMADQGTERMEWFTMHEGVAGISSLMNHSSHIHTLQVVCRSCTHFQIINQNT
jgi:hypothetical protein